MYSNFKVPWPQHSLFILKVKELKLREILSLRMAAPDWDLPSTWSFSVTLMQELSVAKTAPGSSSYYINLLFSISFTKFIYYCTPFTPSLC